MAKRLRLSDEDYIETQGQLQNDTQAHTEEPIKNAPLKEAAPQPPITNIPAPEVVEEKPIAKRGRKPNPIPTERDFISINIGGGIREALEILCNRETLRSGRKVSYNEYIVGILKEHMEENKAYIETMKNAARM